MYLVDTNVLSEPSRRRADPQVLRWVHRTPPEQKFVSALTIGELRRGMEGIRRRDQAQATRLERVLEEIVDAFDDRILVPNLEVCEQWGRLGVPDPLPPIDGLIAATALVHGLTVATRNVRHFEACGVPTVNPFEG